MIQVRVVAPMGVTLHAPLKLKLTPQLLDHRRHALRPAAGGLLEIGKKGVNFVAGDEFAVEGEVTGDASGALIDTKTGRTLASLNGDASAKASAAAAKAAASLRKLL